MAKRLADQSDFVSHGDRITALELGGGGGGGGVSVGAKNQIEVVNAGNDWRIVDDVTLGGTPESETAPSAGDNSQNLAPTVWIQNRLGDIDVTRFGVNDTETPENNADFLTSAFSAANSSSTKRQVYIPNPGKNIALQIGKIDFSPEGGIGAGNRVDGLRIYSGGGHSVDSVIEYAGADEYFWNLKYARFIEFDGISFRYSNPLMRAPLFRMAHDGTLAPTENIAWRNCWFYSSISINYLGDWSSAAAYAAGDVVNVSNKIYRAIQAGTNHAPASNPAYWMEGAFPALAAIDATGLVKGLAENCNFYHTKWAIVGSHSSGYLGAVLHTAAEWATTYASTVLASGEIGFAIDTGNKKRGDGSTAYSALPYYEANFANSMDIERCWFKDLGVGGIGNPGYIFHIRRTNVCEPNWNPEVLENLPFACNVEGRINTASFSSKFIDNEVWDFKSGDGVLKVCGNSVTIEDNIFIMEDHADATIIKAVDLTNSLRIGQNTVFTNVNDSACLFDAGNFAHTELDFHPGTLWGDITAIKNDANVKYLSKKFDSIDTQTLTVMTANVGLTDTVGVSAKGTETVTLTVGSGDNPSITKDIVGQFTFPSPTSIHNGTADYVTFDAPGAVTGDLLVIKPTDELDPDLSYDGEYVTATDTGAARFTNKSASNIDIGGTVWSYSLRQGYATAAKYNVAASDEGTIASAVNQNVDYNAALSNNGIPYTDVSGDGLAYNGLQIDTLASIVPGEVIYDFHQKRTIEQVKLYMLRNDVVYSDTPVEADSASTYGLQDFEYFYWNGSAYVSIHAVTGNSSALNVYDLPAPVKTTKIKIKCTKGAAADDLVRIIEFEAIGI